MNLDARFRVLVFGQVLLGITAFCMAEGNVVLLLIAGGLGSASWLVAEGPKGRPLPRWVVNGGSLVAVSFMVFEVLSRRGGMIVAMGHFTMALQLLMLYARKTNREYSMLLVLSLIQMIGASVLSVSIVYGLLLTAYCGLSLVTVLLFQLKSTGDAVHRMQVAASASAYRAVSGVGDGGEEAKKVGGGRAEALPVLGLGWERPRRPAEVAGPGLRWHLRGTWAVLGLWSAVLAAVIFVLLPRSGEMPMLGVDSSQRIGAKRIGFSTTVSLSGGPLQEGSTDAVMNVALEQFGVNAGGDHRAFLMRGVALDQYDPDAHQWRRSQNAAQSDMPVRFDRASGAQLARLPRPASTLNATVTLRDTSARVLFVPSELRMSSAAVGRVSSEHLGQVVFNPLDRQLSAGDPRSSALIYTVEVSGVPTDELDAQYARFERRPRSQAARERAVRNEAQWLRWWRGRQGEGGGGALEEADAGGEGDGVGESALPTVLGPADWMVDRERALPPQRLNSAWTRQVYARQWPVEEARIRALALEVLEPKGLTRDPEALHDERDSEIAQALAGFLSSEFEYDLSNPRPALGQDPVVAFLFDHRRGHCELFASAHAALCRSLNIPARVITGYRASEYNALGGYYVVRQSHAHAWTEVDTGDRAGWRTYDATPSGEVQRVHASASPGWVAAARQLYEYLEFSWVRSVVAFDARTRASLLRSVNDRFQTALDPELGWPARLWSGVMGWLGPWMGGWPPSLKIQWVGWVLVAGGSALLVLVAVPVGVTWWRRRVQLRRLRLDRLPLRDARRLSRQLGFFLDVGELLERHGYRRPGWQSPASFASELAEAYPLKFGPLVALTETFYDVRFGQLRLEGARKSQVQAHLKQLSANLGER